MAEDQQKAVISSAFPAPPELYKSFTSTNVEALRREVQHASDLEELQPSADYDPLAPQTGTLPTPSTLPPHLQDLIPPPPPRDGQYSLFGVDYTVRSSAQDADPAAPSPQHLSSLLHQILLKFLRIVHILSIDPSMKYYGPAWEQLEALMKEMHDGLNAWRPHQARETLIRMMETQIKEIRAESARVKDSARRAQRVVEDLATKHHLIDKDAAANGRSTDELDNNVNSDGRANDHKRSDTAYLHQQAVWRSIEKELT